MPTWQAVMARSRRSGLSVRPTSETEPLRPSWARERARVRPTPTAAYSEATKKALTPTRKAMTSKATKVLRA